MNFDEYLNETSKIYGNLFSGYSDKLFEESVKLIIDRQKSWGYDEWFQGKKCLDAGCGGGRFLVALSRMGANEVKGIDISKDAVDVANERLKNKNVPNAEAVNASVLKIPFPDNSFDYVVSSGVIHHTPNPYKGYEELVRVLKSGGKLFLSVYGRGGLRWFFKVDIWRYTICKIIPFRTMEKIFRLFGVPANKRYSILDNVYVPYAYRYTEKEIREWLKGKGFENIKRVKFERYDYEKFWSKVIYGQGWLQFYADKKN